MVPGVSHLEDPVFSTRPRVFHITGFPYPVFSTPPDLLPRTPYLGTLAPRLPLPLSPCEILHGHWGVWHSVSAKRIFVLVDSSVSWFTIFNRTSTTESIGDFFLLNAWKRPGIRGNAALIFVVRSTHCCCRVLCFCLFHLLAHSLHSFRTLTVLSCHFIFC